MVYSFFKLILMRTNAVFYPAHRNRISVYWRLFIAVAAANHLLIVPQTRPVSELLHMKGFYIALAFSIPAALLLIELVVRITEWLGVHCSWEGNVLKRVVSQLVYGIGATLLLDFLLVWAYFGIYHQDFFGSSYLRVEWQMVFYMLCALNGLLCVRHFVVQQPERMRKAVADHEELRDYIWVSRGNKRCQVAMEEIVCFCNESHIGYVILKTGEVWHTPYLMKDLERQLCPAFGYRINRSVLLNWTAIKGFENTKNMQAVIILRYPQEAAHFNLLVSRERFRKFKAMYTKVNSG